MNGGGIRRWGPRGLLSRLAGSRNHRSIPVLFGSQTGTAEQVAHTVAGRIDERLAAVGAAGWQAEARSLDGFEKVSWAETRLALFVTSTHGEGEFPDNGVRFWQWLSGARWPSLQKMRYAVLGLGDRSYGHFCGAARQLDGRLTQLGAWRLLPAETCGIDHRDQVQGWIQGLEGLLEEGVEHLCENTGQHRTAAVMVARARKRQPAAVGSPAPPPSGARVLVLSTERLTSEKVERETRPLVLSLEGRDLT